jgi:hypothetical protein
MPKKKHTVSGYWFFNSIIFSTPCSLLQPPSDMKIRQGLEVRKKGNQYSKPNILVTFQVIGS